MTRIWKDPSGVAWEVSVEDPSNAAMAVPLDFQVHRARANPPAWSIIFRDPLDAANHRSVPFDWEHASAEPSDHEIGTY